MDHARRRGADPARGRDHRAFRARSAECEALAERADPVGVLIVAGADAPAQLPEAARRPLAALKFDKFADGRAFSYAELLRERYGFKGELRAIGEVLFDAMPMMRRCSFSSFEVTDAATLRALRQGRRPGRALHYQPSVAAREAPAGTRPWLRRTV